ncbi:MAG: hypothetical protein WDZ84_08870 [Rhodovibrionaceae bacterium]
MRRKARKGGGRQIALRIEAIGARGDGYGDLEGKPVFVPLTQAGDSVLARITGETAAGYRGEIIELEQPGPGRQEPPCPHFGPCGGCALQHLDQVSYRAWKDSLLPRALRQRGLEAEEIRPTAWIGPGTRRRVVLTAQGAGQGLRLGFNERYSHKVVDLRHCLLVTPAILEVLPGLRAALAGVPSGKQGLTVTLSETESGLDLLLEGEKPLDLAAREALAALAEAWDLARISWREARGGEGGEPVAQRRAPKLTFGGVAVTPPPGGFLQPSREGEAALRGLLLEGRPKGAARLLDLFSGCGSFSFPLLGEGALKAVDGDAAAIAALANAARLPALQGRVESERRDLFRRPYLPEELNAFDTVVFDPPRAGAQAQAEQLAASRVPVVLAVSCNPATFARDARLLVDGGYRLRWVAPVDQFVWSPHLELVALFAR